jgi:hypothetical protein
VWSWRRNPLRRGTDRVEAWVALSALLLIGLVAPLLGWLAGSATQDVLRQAMLDEQRQLHQVTAVVVHDNPGVTLPPDPESITRQDVPGLVTASWPTPDGGTRTGKVRVRQGQTDAGTEIVVWVDTAGRLAGPPLDTATVATHAVLAGFGAFALTAALVTGVRRLVLWRQLRRRYAKWDRAWAQVGPDWGRTGTGS